MATESATLAGNLSDLPLIQLLDMVASGRKTGVLEISYPLLNANTALSFADGRVGRVVTPFAPRLTEVMRRFGVPKPYLDELRRRNNESLEELNSIHEYDPVAQVILMQSVRRRHEMALMPIFEEEEGEFVFLFSNVPDGFITPGIDTMALSLDIVKRRDEIQALTDGYRWHPLDRFELVTDATKTYQSRALNLFSYQVLNALTEPHTLQSLAVESALVWDEMIKGLYSLLERGLARGLEPAPSSTDTHNLLLFEEDA